MRFTNPIVPILVSGGLALAAVGAAVMLGTDPVEQARLAARWTARVGFPVFLLTYSASSLARLWPHPMTRAVLRQRRYWGLGFALAHTVHLAALTHYLTISEEQRDLITLAGGGFAYVLLFLMALTSNAAAIRLLGPWWKRLHRLGIHTLWFIFALSYFGRLFDAQTFNLGIVQFSFAIAALGLRVAAWRMARQRTLIGTA